MSVVVLQIDERLDQFRQTLKCPATRQNTSSEEDILCIFVGWQCGEQALIWTVDFSRHGIWQPVTLVAGKIGVKQSVKLSLTRLNKQSEAIVGITLIVFGALFVLILSINNIVRTLRRSESVSFWDTLLAFLATLVSITALVMDNVNFEASQFDVVEIFALAAAAVMAVLSIIVVVIENSGGREFRFTASRGVLGIGGAVLIIISAFVVNVVAANLAPDSAAQEVEIPTPVNALAVVPTRDPGAAPTRTPTPQPTFTPTATRTPMPSDTPTPTIERYATATLTPSPTRVDGCQTTLAYGVLIRAEPSLNDYDEVETLGNAPFGSAVVVNARTEDNRWWQFTYEGITGWTFKDYINLPDDCFTVPAVPYPETDS